MGKAIRQQLRHPSGTTRVLVTDGDVGGLAPLRAWLADANAFAVSSPRVARLHGGWLEAALGPTAADRVLTVPDGEEAKTPRVAEGVLRGLLERGAARDSRLVAFGGGAVGDLTGFVAGCLFRGVRYAQAPTTLVGQVDAAIGGKTGIDLPEAKNAVGLFHHPDLVVADTRHLATLDRRDRIAGLVEVLKMGLAVDPSLLEWAEEHLEALLEGLSELLPETVARAQAAKIAVVEEDPLDRGRRRLLNYGHTLGHALEAAAGYRGLRHGEAVAHGIAFACRLARRLGLGGEGPDRAERLLARLPLPPLPPVRPEELLALVGRDKKRVAGRVTWVLPTGVGSAGCFDDLGDELVAAELAAFLAASEEAC